ncbi:MAG: ABC transporter permease subunit [Phycisphaeraceae bacterium]|nr:ABC transporter permease subunit [Phycisphaeraceae bacterium]
MPERGAASSSVRPASRADFVLRALAWGGMAVLGAGVCWIVGDVVLRGVRGVSLSFLLDAPARSGRDGGIAPVIVSTAIVIGTCMIVVIPSGVLAAVGLSECLRRGGRTAAVIRLGLDIVAGTPSIAFGLFGHAFFCAFLGLRVSLLSGGLTLACMVLPLFIRLCESALLGVPAGTRRAVDALALTRRTALRRVVLPIAFPGIVSAAVFSLARALAETAALLFTTGYMLRMPGSLLDPGRVLSVHIYDLAMNVPGGDPNAYATALVLLAAVLVIGLVPLRVRRVRADRLVIT